MELLSVVQNSSNDMQKFGPYTGWVVGVTNCLLVPSAWNCDSVWYHMARSQPQNQDLQRALSMLSACFSPYSRVHLGTREFSCSFRISVVGGNAVRHAMFFSGWKLVGVPWKQVVTVCCCGQLCLNVAGEGKPPLLSLWRLTEEVKSQCYLFWLCPASGVTKEWWEL